MRSQIYITRFEFGRSDFTVVLSVVHLPRGTKFSPIGQGLRGQYFCSANTVQIRPQMYVVAIDFGRGDCTVVLGIIC